MRKDRAIKQRVTGAKKRTTRATGEWPKKNHQEMLARRQLLPKARKNRVEDRGKKRKTPRTRNGISRRSTPPPRSSRRRLPSFARPTAARDGRARVGHRARRRRGTPARIASRRTTTVGTATIPPTRRTWRSSRSGAPATSAQPLTIACPRKTGPWRLHSRRRQRQARRMIPLTMAPENPPLPQRRRGGRARLAHLKIRRRGRHVRCALRREGSDLVRFTPCRSPELTRTMLLQSMNP
mmetsp:Transcript_46759/g.141663  ORF Transcript_46759/g.141663 Transcript_46759/m.141663 type:complete len:238 (-) Transcript_46759:43-756(-)